MKKIWTLVASTMLVASVAFAQDDFDDMDQSAEQYTEQEQAEFQAEDQAGEAPEEESSEASTVQNNNQVTNQVNNQDNDYAQANQNAQSEVPAEEPVQSRAAESRFGFGVRGAFDYGMMYGFSEEDDDIDQTPRGVGFEGGIMFKMMMVNNLFFAPEINIAYILTSHTYLEKYDRTYHSLDLEIPLLIRGVVADKFYITAGPQANISLSSGADIDPIENKTLDIKAKTEEKVEQTGFTFGLAAGAGFNIVKGLFIDLRYYMGLMELFPDVKTLDDIENFENEDFSIVSMKGAKMMKFKVGLSYLFM
ncbi:porin family protein [Fibrobacter sp.]|uniref:porin family protein n=1 Tax=Fibrobacter sp. TaxID=35828 RepID=UPI00388F6665